VCPSKKLIILMLDTRKQHAILGHWREPYKQESTSMHQQDAIINRITSRHVARLLTRLEQNECHPLLCEQAKKELWLMADDIKQEVSTSTSMEYDNDQIHRSVQR
jgi:hypothetical protein